MVVSYTLPIVSIALSLLIGAVFVCRAAPRPAGPLIRYHEQWMAAYRAAVPLAHANQLPLPRL